MTPTPRKASILIVEDDPAILNGLLDVLVFNGFGAKGAMDGGKGLALALEEPFDLIILDVMMPVMDGFSLCKTIREKKPDQAIIMLTAKGAEDDVVTGFKSGADDYIAKPFSLKELMVRIEAILRRTGKALGGETIILKTIHFDGAMLKATCNEKTVDLTRWEMDIITYLSKNQGRIVTRKDLLTHVWHYKDADIETRTVDIHMLKLRKKIATLNPDAMVIQTRRGEGYILET